MSQSIVINTSIGGFGLSSLAAKRYAELKGIKLYFEYYEQDPKFYRAYTKPKEERTDNDGSLFCDFAIERDDPALVQTVKELGSKADSPHSHLKIVEIPNGVDWEIDESDEGYEWVAEKHRKWS
jgi:hypothetical protein